MLRKRKNYVPEKKVRMLKKNLLEKVPVSDLCDHYGFHQQRPLKNPTIFGCG